MQKVIEVKQKPIIEYSIIDEISQNVEAKIASLDIDSLEPTENNLSLIKSTRAELNNEFKILEEQRKLVKDIVLKDYNAFEDKYKNMIASKFKEVDATLKGLVDVVTDEILQVKINGMIEYFNTKNEYDFVKFEDLELKIIKSKSDKKIQYEIDEYLESIKQALETIETLPDKERVLAKFQMSKNLSDAIAQTNLEIQREEQIKAQNEARANAEQERKEQLVQEELQTFKSSFTVYGTKEQFKALKEFMNENHIKYEGV